MSEIMLKLRQIEQDILATGKVDGPELERLRRELYAHDKIELNEQAYTTRRGKPWNPMQVKHVLDRVARV